MIPRALKVVKWLYFVNNVVPFYNASEKSMWERGCHQCMWAEVAVCNKLCFSRNKKYHHIYTAVGFLLLLNFWLFAHIWKLFAFIGTISVKLTHCQGCLGVHMAVCLNPRLAAPLPEMSTLRRHRLPTMTLPCLRLSTTKSDKNGPKVS